MKIKVCGLREPDNLAAVAALGADMLGLIFHPASPRFVGDLPLSALPVGVRRVGVFVDADLDQVLLTVNRYGLDYVQLHGHESPGYCAAVHGFVPVIKAFRVDAAFDFDSTAAYTNCAELFLFDTKGAQPGGNGVRFDWSLLDGYMGEVGFLLSGGIQPGDAADIHALRHPQLIGIDLNSGFETAPGHKSIPALTDFIHQIRPQ
jgi:phosphoribosylanthranilate isomerase